MDLSLKLISFREYMKWEQEFVASKISISLDDYKALESGCGDINLEILLSLSKLYKVPEVIFCNNDGANHLSIIYSQCTFNGSNGYVNHFNNENSIKIELLEVLKSEIIALKEHNNNLITLLNKKNI
jgi:DNA-binding XRE family transcriptional regulator